MNYVLAIQSMNLFCTNCQEALHQVYEGGAVGAAEPTDHRGTVTQSCWSYSPIY